MTTTDNKDVKKMEDPLEQYPTPPFEEQQQTFPGSEDQLQPGWNGAEPQCKMR